MATDDTRNETDALTITFEGRTLPARQGQTLRAALLATGASPHNGSSAWLNCKGFGSCGTCAVEVTGAVSAPQARELLRLRVPPHHPDAGLRLACQARLNGDVEVRKHPGFWGQEVPRGRVRARAFTGSERP